MRIRLLGGFEVGEGEQFVAPGAWRLRKAKTLVKLLALEPSHRLHRDEVSDRLWPELDSEAARNNLHQVLHAARRALSTLGVDGAAALALRDDVVVLGSDGDVVTDLEEFRESVERAASSRDPAALADALSVSRAELLPEDRYEPWLREQADQLREWRIAKLLTLVDDAAEDDLARRDPETAITLLGAEVAANPLHEPLHRAMMRALDAAGRHAEALVLFERLRASLLQELAAEPDSRSRRLYKELLASRARDAAAPDGGPADGPVVALPARVTPLIGRAHDLDETARALAHARLLTLVGPGGAGKTSLAIELARREAARYPDGVWLIELGAVFDGDLIVEEVASALQLQLPSRDSPLDALVAQLRDRRLLLVLDNCEHLIDACARVVIELLRGCAGLTVLATSREPLRIEGEVTWRTPSLALPDPEHLPGLPTLATVASMQLFVRRAKAASAGFTLTDANAAAVAEICCRLDGMPLALELAAACTPTLSPQQIATRLGDALGLLSRGHRGAITRQQTLAATLGWSHDLLAEQERALLRRLAVFAGPFTLEAAERVGGGEEVFGSLARLVDTSLVLADPRADGTRYRLLETVRQYAMDKLRAAGEEAMARQRHCAWYVDFSESRDPETAANSVEFVPAGLDVENDNLRAALSWALAEEPLKALQLAVALWRYWLARGLFAEGRRWLEAALAAVPQPSVMRVRALLALAVFDVRRGSARRLADIATEAVDTAEPGAARAMALTENGVLTYMRGRWDECWQRSLEAEASWAAPEVLANCAHLQGMVLFGRGDPAGARQAFLRAQSALAEVTTPQPQFRMLNLGWAVEWPGPSPRLYFEETVLPGPLVSAGPAQGYVLCDLAFVARAMGQLDEARRLIDEAISMFTMLGDRDGEALAANQLGCLHRVRGDYGAARRSLDHGLTLRRGIGDRRAIGLTVSNLGLLAAAEGDFGRGLALLGQALDGFRETEDAPGRVAISLTMASVHAQRGDYDAARMLLVGALPEARQIPGNHRATPWAYVVLSDLERHLGRSTEADRARSDADELFRALGAIGPGTSVRQGPLVTDREAD